jgi:N-methylhydantoinase A/oxoprolinase/acetone carboxylase beta subunit
MTLRPELSEKVIMEKIGAPLGQTLAEAALGIIEILNHNMIQEIEKESVRRGLDPRDFALFACGGAGALHACDVARELGMKQVIVPSKPGALCAVGLVSTDLQYDYSHTEMQLSSRPELQKLDADYNALEKRARERLYADKIAPGDSVLERVADCRYEGQGYELRVPVLSGKVEVATIEALVEAFHTVHKKQFGRSFRNNAVEIVNIRVIGIGKLPDIEPAKLACGSADAAEALTGEVRGVIFKVDGAIASLPAKVYERGKLKANNMIPGPAIINQMDTTILVEPGCTAWVNEYGSIRIDIA